MIVRNRTNDGGRSSEIALQEEVSNSLKRLMSKALVVSVKEKALLKVSCVD